MGRLKNKVCKNFVKMISCKNYFHEKFRENDFTEKFFSRKIFLNKYANHFRVLAFQKMGEIVQ